MGNQKKFGAFAIHATDGSYTARVVRRRTSRGTVVERERSGFENHETAQAWAAEQLELYLTQRKERNLKNNASRSASKIRRAEREEVVRGYNLRELVERSEYERDCHEAFKREAELLWQEVAFRMLKEGASDDEAFAEANTRVGRKYQERVEKAKSGLLDTVEFGTTQMAMANAQFLMQQGMEISTEMKCGTDDDDDDDYDDLM